MQQILTIQVIGSLLVLIGYLLTMSYFDRIFLGYTDNTRTIIKHEGYYNPKSIKGRFLRKRKPFGVILIIVGITSTIFTILIQLYSSPS